jgi:hypothetical protein
LGRVGSIHFSHAVMKKSSKNRSTALILQGLMVTSVTKGGAQKLVKTRGGADHEKNECSEDLMSTVQFITFTANKEQRILEAKQSLLKTIPTKEESVLVHDMFVSTLNPWYLQLYLILSIASHLCDNLCDNLCHGWIF